MIIPVGDLLAERRRQDALYGVAHQRGYTPDRWLRVLAAEVGEVADAIEDDDLDNLRVELIQVAAVAIAFHDALRGENHEEPT